MINGREWTWDSEGSNIKEVKNKNPIRRKTRRPWVDRNHNNRQSKENGYQQQGQTNEIKEISNMRKNKKKLRQKDEKGKNLRFILGKDDKLVKEIINKHIDTFGITELKKKRIHKGHGMWWTVVDEGERARYGNVRKRKLDYPNWI